jgi:hypothetical protein
MKPNASSLTLSPELLNQWEKEKDRLEKVIVEAQRKLAAIHALLRAGAVLSGVEAQEEDEGSEIDPSNLMGSLAKIANESQKPLTKAELKAELRAAGVPESRLGSYFYVAIDRLKKRGRITVRDDGSVWRAE